MSSSSSGNNAAAPESVSQAITSFGEGELSLLEVRRQVVVALEEGPDCAEAIHDLLDEELKSRTLTIADYGELVGVVGAVVSENVPTEFSDDTPGQSGIYRVVGEGTLVLAEEDALLAVNSDDAAAVAEEPAEEDDQTRPFGAELSEPEVVVDAVEVGTVLRDRYRLDEEVARGAMGVVYRATDLIKLEAGAADPQLAVKVVSPEFAGDEKALRAFQNEVANTQHLSHPHIIHLFELDQDDGRHFITMEWLEGESLAALLDRTRGTSLEQGQAYAIIEQLCDALIYAHEQNVVHADVKPGNVFLLESGDVKLIDFGIAKSQAGESVDTDGEAIALTPAYASCERLEKAEPTPQDDLFSLACLAYRLLAGRRVFGPLTALEAEAQQAEVVSVGGLDDERQAALVKALSFRREDRQADVSGFAEQFGRRTETRDTAADEADDAVATDTTADDATLDETTEMPVLTAADAEMVAAEAMQPDLEVDFAFEEEAAEEPDEPELSGIFAAAAAGDTDVFAEAPTEEPAAKESTEDSVEQSTEESTEQSTDEEIVLESAPVAEPVTLEELTGKFGSEDLQVDDSDADASQPIAEPAVAQLAQEKAPVETNVAAGWTPQQLQLVAGIAGVLLVIGVAALGLFGGDEEVAVPRQVSMPAPVVAPEPSPAPELLPGPEAEEVPEPGLAAVAQEEPQQVAEESVAEEPVVDESLVEESVIEEPVAEEPLVEEAVAVATATQPEPVIAEPAVSEPVVSEPVVSEPVVSEPVVSEPVVSEPAAETVVADTVVIEEPVNESAVVADVTAAAAVAAAVVTEAASVEAPVADAVVVEPAVTEAVADEPVIAEPVVAEPVIAESPAEAVAAEEAAVADDTVQEIAEEAVAEPAVPAAEPVVVQGPVQEPSLPAESVAPVFDPRQPVPLSELELVKYSEPKFPRGAGDRTYDGWVDVEFRVGTDGKPRNIEVIGSNLPSRFEAPSINAVKKWRFEPYVVNDAPVAVYSGVRLRFAN